MVEFSWRDTFDSDDVERLHAECFGREPAYEWNWFRQCDEHSLGWVCARVSGALVGWVNVAWDGGVHAFLIDAIVHPQFRRRGIATELVRQATTHSRLGGCEWLHVDFDPHLTSFYWDTCGFAPTDAGVIAL
ncbi:MAG: GNAT family N-acetyltransferase [Actinomycetes bacterium]